MLTPEQIIPFLLHEDSIVRAHAISYFGNSFNFGPLTADHYWAAIDRFGTTPEARSYAAAMPGVPQTDASMLRLIHALESPQDHGLQSSLDRDLQFDYQRVAYHIELPVLVRHREQLLACTGLAPHVRRHLELRLSLIDSSPVEAWHDLLRAGHKLADAYAGGFDESPSDALIEVASRGGSEICENAMAVLAGPSVSDDWQQIFAARVLGTARHEPAVAILIRQLELDADVLRESVVTALAQIGTPDVVDALLRFYPDQPWHVRLYAREPFARIKLPASEAALMKLLDVELKFQAELNPDADDDESDEDGLAIVDQILNDLATLCSLAGLEESRRFIADNPDDAEGEGLAEALLATATMNGIVLPDDVQWRRSAAEQQERMAVAIQQMDSVSRSIQASWLKSGKTEPDIDEGEPRTAYPAAAMRQIVQPIQNTAPKVGRNDPCPCGSGKKYKKCCGK